MNTALKWKLTAGFLLAFLAGGATGGFLAASQGRHLRSHFAHPHPWLVERMRGRMQAKLNLTPQQVEKTAPIFDRAASELEKVRAETGARVRQIMAEASRALGPELTDAQRARLDALGKRPRSGRKSRNAPHNRAPQPPREKADSH
jgi:Spy/CpxP family protein refolding chaperone